MNMPKQKNKQNKQKKKTNSRVAEIFVTKYYQLYLR